MLLTAEAEMTKGLYNLAVDAVGYGDFTRAKRGEGTDVANRFLDHGNYLAYGMGATATWVLGLPHALAVLHGKTRRGALVFDAADLVKDAVILPLAFVAAMRGDQDQQFRVACLDALARTEALDFIIECLKAVAVGELVATCERAYKLRQISHPIAPVRSPRSGARYHVTTRRHHLTSEARSP
jgi:CRISPR-associated protein Cas1